MMSYEMQTPSVNTLNFQHQCKPSVKMMMIKWCRVDCLKSELWNVEKNQVALKMKQKQIHEMCVHCVGIDSQQNWRHPLLKIIPTVQKKMS